LYKLEDGRGLRQDMNNIQGTRWISPGNLKKGSDLEEDRRDGEEMN